MGIVYAIIFMALFVLLLFGLQKHFGIGAVRTIKQAHKMYEYENSNKNSIDIIRNYYPELLSFAIARCKKKLFAMTYDNIDTETRKICKKIDIEYTQIVVEAEFLEKYRKKHFVKMNLKDLLKIYADNPSEYNSYFDKPFYKTLFEKYVENRDRILIFLAKGTI